MKVLVFTNLYPNGCNPNFGIFTRNRTLALSKIKNVEVKVVAPVPYFPPIKISEKWYRFSQIPSYEVIDGIEVYHPRYLVTPKVGMSFYGYWMYQGVRKTIERIRNDFSFDVIEAHFLYPDGYAASLLGGYFNCPVVLNALGSDITSYTQIPSIQKRISKALKSADHSVAVSNSLRDIMIVNGARLEKVSVIPNGIDPERFFLKDSLSIRQSLGFSNDEKLLLTVCSLVELKGVHLLIEAAAILKKSYSGKFTILIAGSGPEKDRLNALINLFDLHEQVRFLGNVPNPELVDWYNVADTFFLGSSREGWPNVVCEALACGTPVVATNVNGIPEILNEEGLGVMVKRSPEAFAQGIMNSFSRNWDAQAIAEKGKQRTWGKVASEVLDLFYVVAKKKKIRVLHILHSFGIGGMEKGISMLINHASPEFEHIILCLTCSGDSKYLISDSIAIYEMNKPPGNSIKFIFKLAQKIREIRPDVVHTRNWGGMDGVVASLFAGCPRIVHGEHGCGIDDPQGANSKRKFVRRWLSLVIKEFTAVSSPLKEWLEKEVRVFGPVNQIYNGVDFSAVKDRSCGAMLRQELGLPVNSLLVGTVGRLDPIKDQAGLIRAFRSVREQIKDCHLLIVGDGSERSNLENLSYEGIHLLGMRTDIPEIMQSLDIFVLPSLSEGVSNTILEAMAAGLPVVATAVGGTPELIKHEKNGLLIEPRDYVSLTAAIERYLDDAELRKLHGERNKAIIMENFSIASMVAGYERVWRRVLLGGSGEVE